ncbi:MAG: hypothetical protein U1F65_02900 [Verrucomicrobiota bacterium]
MDDTVPFASNVYWLMLALLAFARAMDFISTWVATPELVLEGNPIAKKLGWRRGILLNIVICLGVAFWPASAVAVSTTSVLVAARNFQSAWLMRLMGEEAYRDWYVARIQEANLAVYLVCLAGNSLLHVGIGVALIWFGGYNWIAAAIGLGMVVYAIAVVVYTSLAAWRIRRHVRKPHLTVVNPAISSKMEHDVSLN